MDTDNALDVVLHIVCEAVHPAEQASEDRMDCEDNAKHNASASTESSARAPSGGGAMDTDADTPRVEKGSSKDGKWDAGKCEVEKRACGEDDDETDAKRQKCNAAGLADLERALMQSCRGFLRRWLFL